MEINSSWFGSLGLKGADLADARPADNLGGSRYH